MKKSVTCCPPMVGVPVEKIINSVCLFDAGNKNFRFRTVLKASTTRSQQGS